MKRNRLISLLYFFLLTLFAFAQQETVIRGRVTEKGSNSGVAFANIYFKGTFSGTITDFDGNYEIRTTTPTDSIFVSVIGYRSRSKPVKKGLTQVIDFQMSPETMTLNVVEVHPGVNPALRIIRNAQANREKYDRDQLSSVQFISYTKQEADVDNVSPKMRKRKFLRGITRMWDRLDTLAGEDSEANLPVMMSEVISEIYSYKEGAQKRENVNAVKIRFVGMKDGSAMSQLTGTDFQNYNFNKDNVAIQGKDFLSPIAANAMLFYNYYLIDSVIIDSMKCYRIDCRPKNPQDLAYTGTLWITDSTFAVKQLDLELTKEVNFNLVDRARIQQVLIPTEAGPWVPVQTRVMIDYAKLTKRLVSMVYRTTNYNTDYVVNQPRQKDFYEQRIQFAEDAITKDSAYWVNNRPEQLTPLEAQSYNMIDTVRSLPVIKNAVNVLYFLVFGYITAGPVDIGHYINVYGYNNYEGTRLRLGFRTNQKFSKSWILRGYGAYGFKDEGFKYNLQVERILTRFPWSKAGVQYREDIDQIGTGYNFSATSNIGQSPNNLYNTFSQIGNISKLVRKQEARIWYEKDFNPGISASLTFQNTRTTPLFPVTFGDQFSIFQQRKYSITEIILNTRISVKERFVQNGTERISLGNKRSPIINVRYTLGIKGLLDGDFNYNKVNISFSNRFKTAMFGYSSFHLDVGKVFSKVPYIHLQIPRGNQTYLMANNTFNQMNYFEFVSDQYFEAYWQHHFSGVIFNRLPLIKKLNLREVVGLNMAYGTLSRKNRDFNSNNYFTVMEDVPYVEADLGIENILDVIRIDFLYRLTYNDDFYLREYEKNNPGNPISNWSIKAGLQFSF